MPEVHWPASLAKLMGPGLLRDPVPQNKGGEELKKDIWYQPLASMYS